jgi:hypothetical protein
MTIKCFLSIILLFFLSTVASLGQSDSIDLYLERLIEAYAENNDGGESFDYAANFEVLDDIRKRPYDLNKVSEEELNNLFFLNASQRQAIVNHRIEYGDFISLEELQSVDELDNDVIKIISFFLTVTPRVENEFKLGNIFAAPKQTLFLKYKRVMQSRSGYEKDTNGISNYLGDPNHLFMRYRFDSNNNFALGFTAEKDPGEQFFTGSNKKGFDYYSGYIFIKNVSRRIKSIALGDYTLSFGQGLILHNDFGAGKSAFVMNIKKGGRVIRPYSSVNESNYFRGAAVTILPAKNMELTLLYSNKKIDGSINNDTLDIDGFDEVTSILRDGYHRTEAEITKQNSLTQTNFGGRLSYKKGNVSLGLHHLTYIFSNEYSRSNEPYNLYTFRGTQLGNTGIDYNYYYKNFTFFGEVARSDNGSLAQIHSLLMPLDRRLDFSISYRNFAPDYQVLEANAFSEASLPINEKALYMGIEARPNNAWKFSTYLDFWKNPWLKYRVDAPSDGKEVLVRAEYTIKRKFNVYLQYRYEAKYLNNSIPDAKIDYIVPIIQNRLRFHAAHKVNKEIELRSRAELSWYSKEGKTTKGYMVYQDLIFKPIGKSYSFSARYALFDTDGFDTRIYTYENDILYEFAIPFFSNTGKRAYINFRHKLTDYLTWEARYAVTSYDNLTALSDGGNEEITGSVKSDVKFQLKMSF